MISLISTEAEEFPQQSNTSMVTPPQNPRGNDNFVIMSDHLANEREPLCLPHLLRQNKLHLEQVEQDSEGNGRAEAAREHRGALRQAQATLTAARGQRK